ncbi:hypothetical protein SAMN05216249_11770 [Acetitomaculum ruminis DSM 5522]|uniref:Uncharacterized protein n=1 Tax=Acetitomaculum ruminis DSM 5522 TaxID=1120918 RepID=A0A1I0ZY44_9FIRM|nr:hypothetical protein [Acetitomaculum ruminis]SFB29198.1 hypothetical protein SAMN05216249_11770 [Acetitomaculum ruminis DSM 5522]
MNNHLKKKIAPVIITIIMVLYYFIYFIFLMTIFKGVARMLLGVAPFLLSMVMIGVCIQRLKEIDGGEEDDLSKY